MDLLVLRSVIGLLVILWMMDFLSPPATTSHRARIKRVIGSFLCFFPVWAFMLHPYQLTVLADRTLASAGLSEWMHENVLLTLMSCGVGLAFAAPLLAIYRWTFISEMAGACLLATVSVFFAATFLPLASMVD
jgi:hypothetical protein